MNHHEFTEKDMLNARSRADKIKVFTDLIDRGEVFVHANTRAYGVRVPPRLLEAGPQVVMKFSKNYGPKLEILEEGIEQALSFQGEQFPVFISWDAIFTIRDESGTIGIAFPWSAPDELVKVEEPKQYLN